MTDKKKGLIGKFIVKRVDGQHRKGKKHERCWYFVLDLTHDPLAYPAVAAYERWARKAGYVALADDLLRKLFQMQNSTMLIREDAPMQPMFPGGVLTLAQKRRMREVVGR